MSLIPFFCKIPLSNNFNMAPSKKAITNTLIAHGIGGAPKVSALRMTKEAYNLTDNELEWALEAANFNSPPEKIDYKKFFYNNITKIAKKVDNPHIQLYYIDNFLTRTDCQLLRGYIDQTAHPSTLHDVGSKDDIRIRKENERTSSQIFIDWRNSKFFSYIDRKITAAVQLHPFSGEGMVGQKYEIGEFYIRHPDYFLEKDIETYCTWMGQRTWTTMLYLNDVEEGGETQFPNLNIKMKPKEGTLIAWNNLYIDGTSNPNTLHEALPPKSGKKYIITKWWRSWNLL